MQNQYPDYTPSSASLEYIQAQIISILLADLAQLASSGGDELFRTYGTTLVGLPYQPGTAASAVINVSTAPSPPVLTLLSGTLSPAGPTGSLPIVAPQYGIAAGTVTLTDPTNTYTQNWTTTGATAGSTSLPVTAQTPLNFGGSGTSFPTGSSISGTAVYTLPALSQFMLDQLGFYNLAPATITAGTSQSVTVTAVQSGTLFDGAGSGGSVQLLQPMSWITSISLSGGGASGGNDPESDSHYLNRLVGFLQLQAPRPITAQDFANMAVNFQPAQGTDQQSVGRATALDGYNSTNQTYNNERTVTVCVTDSNGFALNSDTMFGYPNGTVSSPILTPPALSSGWGIQGWLTSLREINFIVDVISPTYSLIYIAVTVKAAPGYDSTSVQNAVQAALLSYLAPATWGLPPASAQGWLNNTTIYASNVESVIVQTGVVSYVAASSPGSSVSSLQMGLAYNTLFPSDLVLPGPVALPISNVSAMTITVT